MNTKRILALFLAVVTCLSLAVSASAASISDFKDVDTKAWYAEAATAAVDNGLLYGKSKTQLDPNGLLTRAEMARDRQVTTARNSARIRFVFKVNPSYKIKAAGGSRFPRRWMGAA